MTVASVVEQINRAHGTRYTLGTSFHGGEQGAIELIDPFGNRSVLKTHSNREWLRQVKSARRVTDLLRARGYPAPRYREAGIVAGVAYAVQEVVPGEPAGLLVPEHLPEVFALNDLQAGGWPGQPGDWPTRIVDSVLRGSAEFCVIDSLRTHSAATNRLLTTLQRLVVRYREQVAPTSDIVHFDFHPNNIMLDNGRISGVIDWEGTCAGDRSFDLATMLFYSYTDPIVRQRIMARILSQTNVAVLLLSLSHIAVRQVDWSIRHYDAVTTAGWLRRAERVTDDIRALADRCTTGSML